METKIVYFECSGESSVQGDSESTEVLGVSTEAVSGSYTVVVFNIL